MFFNNPNYFIKEALNNIKGNSLVAAVTTFTIALSLLISGFFLIIFLNLYDLLLSWREKVQIIVYMEDRLSSEEISAIIETVRTEKEIEGVTYITKEKALSDFEKEVEWLSGVLEGLGKNPLPASLEVKVKKEYQGSKMVASLAGRLKEIGGIEEVQYGEEWIENFSIFVGIMKLSGIILGGLLGTAIVFIVSNTVNLTLYARKEEMEILRLIGATEGFVKAPFVIEGSILGLIGASLSLLVTWVLYEFVILRTPVLTGLLEKGLNLSFLPPQVALGMILLGTFLGSLGGLFSLARVYR